MRIDATRVALSLGVSTSSYVDRPATDAAPDVVTVVSLPIMARTADAAWSGVSGTPVGRLPVGRGAAVPDPAAPTVWCTAVLSALDHSHRSEPLRITSDSPLVPTRARRCRVGPSTQMRQVWVPDASEVSELPAAPVTPPPPPPPPPPA